MDFDSYNVFGKCHGPQIADVLDGDWEFIEGDLEVPSWTIVEFDYELAEPMGPPDLEEISFIPVFPCECIAWDEGCLLRIGN